MHVATALCFSTTLLVGCGKSDSEKKNATAASDPQNRSARFDQRAGTNANSLRAAARPTPSAGNSRPNIPLPKTFPNSAAVTSAPPPISAPGVTVTQDVPHIGARGLTGEALTKLQQAAQAGDVKAQTRLGLAYLNGQIGTEKNPLEAQAMFEKAAAGGDAMAKLQLSLLTNAAQGKSIPESELNGMYFAAAQQGYGDASLELSRRYANGVGVEKDPAQALAWMQKAAQQDNADAEYQLGMKYARGQGVDQNDPAAIDLYTKAAAQGHSEALHTLAVRYLGGTGVPKDEAKAAELYAEAALQGNTRSQYNLAVMYSLGTGVDKSDATAADLYLQAANGGHAMAQTKLYELYLNGTGVPVDPIESYKWYLVGAASVGAQPDPQKTKEIFGARLTPEQMSEGQKRAADFRVGRVGQSVPGTK